MCINRTFIRNYGRILKMNIESFFTKVFNKIFKKKVKDGPFEDKYKNGLILEKGILKNGKLEGISTLYYETGELNQITFYENSRICWCKGFYKSGNIESETVYEEGKELGTNTFPDKIEHN